MRVNIDEEKLFSLVALGAPLSDVAAEMGIPEGTIRHRCADVVRRGRARRNITLLRAMWRAAVKQGSVPAQKFLAMQFLGFSEKRTDTAELDAELAAELAKHGIPFAAPGKP